MYKLLLLGIVLLLISFKTNAQVGINTHDPKAQLDISIEDPASPENTDGILIPRMSNFPATNPTEAQHGMLIFLTSQKLEFPTGFYWWNSSLVAWESVGRKATSDFYKIGTTSPSTSPEDAVFRKGNVSIGGSSQNVKLKVIIDDKEDHLIRTGLEVDNASSTAKNVTYGIVTSNNTATADKKYGIKSSVSANGIGIHYGIFNEVNQNTNEEIYGIYNDVGKTFGSTKNHYGIYNEIGTVQGNGFVYGIYSTAYGNDPKKVYAGYFSGRVGIGTTGNDYVLPDVRGSHDQVLMTDASGIVSWKYPYSGTYSSTASNTGAFIIPEETYSLRINNQVSSVVIPDAATNKGRLIYLINWPGNSKKILDFIGSNDLFDITTNSTVTSIDPGTKYLIQSAGNRWILLDK
ncbi:hypothetical protein [Salinimicrobium sp. TH3]|uniref:hypothetical protein n=1 Tax=Salinimicrobium sp. TH3 TaxID=2997342 RepID=UPI0022737F4E|nr:hypothetical protein [Salinimicrobium sp. TH3]MCY2687373.1 hypothetical protein [Salinimicrobium sp. TH3]